MKTSITKLLLCRCSQTHILCKFTYILMPWGAQIYERFKLNNLNIITILNQTHNYYCPSKNIFYGKYTYFLMPWQGHRRRSGRSGARRTTFLAEHAFGRTTFFFFFFFFSLFCCAYSLSVNFFNRICCFVVYSTRRFVLCLTMYYLFLCFSVLLALRLPRLGKRDVILVLFVHHFVRFALVWFRLFPLSLGVWKGLRFVIVALPGLFSGAY